MRKGINPNYMQMNTQPTEEQPSQTDAHRLVMEIVRVEQETVAQKTVDLAKSREIEAECKQIRDGLGREQKEIPPAKEDTEWATKAVLLRARAFPRKVE